MHIRCFVPLKWSLFSVLSLCSSCEAVTSTHSDPVSLVGTNPEPVEAGPGIRGESDAAFLVDAAMDAARDQPPAAPAPPSHEGEPLPDREDASNNADVDVRGIRMVYPTTSGGRTWYLPADAQNPSDEWNVERNAVTRVSEGVFHTVGKDGETRLSVASPQGRAWWRNVEMTGYFRYTAPHDSFGQERHWALLARNEKHHSESILPSSQINGGVKAPAGTAVWQGFPANADTVNGRCLASSYHGNLYVAGHALLEKEISHTDGYAGPRGKTKPNELTDPLNRWFGLKFVLRNAEGDKRVHLELWLDANADQNWKKITETDDTPGSWRASDSALDGCAEPPFSYAPDQLVTWAGPWITFRSDSIEMDFRDLSAREIAPL